MNFQIMKHTGGREFTPAINQLTKKPIIFDCPKKAAKEAARLTALNGVKFQPRPIHDITDLTGWRDRERNRFKSGEYKPVVWAKEPWWKDLPDHFAHVGIKDKTRIAFTPDSIKGEMDKQTAMLPGKYLKQFFGDVLTDEQIRDYAMQHNTQFEQNELFFARTPEEIQEVYKPYLGSSCFSGTTNANLYGSGDFAVAYIKNTNGKITARCVVVPERKLYVRVYGDDARLATLLKKAGFRNPGYGTDEYKGLRLLKKWMWDGFYADFGLNGRPQPDPNNKEYLIIQ